MNLPSAIPFLQWIVIPVLLLGVLFLLRSGLLVRWRTWQSAVFRQQVEDALKYMLDFQQEGRPASINELGRALRLPRRKTLALISRMQAQGLIDQRQGNWVLSPEGQRWALQVARAHRLWERYLADEARMPLNQIHKLAHQREHSMTVEQIDSLDAALGHPLNDPHGDPIPDAQGVLRGRASEQQSTPLTAWKPGERGIITHLEDEPEAAYAQLLALGLQVGKVITVVESNPQKIVVLEGENELIIAPLIAANVHLAPVTESKTPTGGVILLRDLPTQVPAEVVELDERCQGFTRRRFLDLGLTPGALIIPELENAFREPRAYRVRGTLIALRNDQAAQIWVRPATE